MHPGSRSTILVLAAISFAVTLVDVPRQDWFTLAVLSLATGVMAVALMGVAALLGGRFKLIESLYGGLDRVYLTHKWLGVWALVFASVHFAFKAGLPEWETAAIITLPPFWMRLVRQLSLLGLALILILALNRRIPYHLWRWWHKLSGPLFVIVILHWLSIKSRIELASPAGVWLALVSTIGVVAAAYKLFLYPFISNHAEYRVVTAEPGANAMHLALAPVGKPIDFKSGQFGFIALKEDGLREPHPFTIASGSGGAGHVHFVIRDLGDYTHKLVNEARVGMHADIYAPYGRFRRPIAAKREVWIAGGVGISPFIAWLTAENAQNLGKVTLFYFFAPGREFPSAKVLEEIARNGGAEFVQIPTGPKSPEFVQRFGAIARENEPTNVAVAFCGPEGLLNRVREVMRETGVPEANLCYEYFEFR